jgi:hypothetical protein
MKTKQNKMIVSAVFASFFWVAVFYQVVSAMSLPSMDNLVKMPTVQDCVQTMGMTEAECQELVASFGGDISGDVTEPQAEAQGQTAPLGGGNATIGAKPTLGSGKATSANFKNMKQKKERSLTEVETRIEKIIEFSQTKDADIEPLRGNLSVFREKQQAVSDEYDTLADYLANAEKNSLEVDQQIVNEHQATIKIKAQELIEFFRTTIKPSAQELIAKIQ